MVRQPGRRVAAALTAAAIAFIAFMTLRPVDFGVALPTSCIICGPLGGVDFTLNTVLFVPFGLALMWLTGHWRRPALIGAVTTLCIETLQWRLIPGRDASLGDLLANCMGTLIGAWLAVAGLRWLNATRIDARRLAAVASLLTVAAVAVSAWLLLPTQTRGQQWVQWTPRRRALDLFQGRLREVSLNGIDIRPTEILDASRTLDTGTNSLSVRATVSEPVPLTRRQAIVVRIANEREEGFSLAQWRDAVVFRTHLTAARLKLRPLLVGLDGAFLSSASTTNGDGKHLTIEAVSTPRAMMVKRESSRVGQISVTLRRTVGLAWALFLPWDIGLGPSWYLVNAAWLAVLLLPVSIFSIRAARRSPDAPGSVVSCWPTAVVVGSIVVVPGAMGLSTLGSVEWAGVAFGIVAGLMIERWSASRRRAGLNVDAPSGTVRM